MEVVLLLLVLHLGQWSRRDATRCVCSSHTVFSDLSGKPVISEQALTLLCTVPLQPRDGMLPAGYRECHDILSETVVECPQCDTEDSAAAAGIC